MSDVIEFNYKDHWQEQTIDLHRSSQDNKSLGFSIAGGIDKPLVDHHFTFFIVTRITENSLAHRDNRLKVYDIILSVNNIDFTNIKHNVAVDILRASGQNVELRIRRLSPRINDEIELKHNRKLGISLGGGIGTELFLKDPGIFITNIDKNQTNKQLDIGDRLIQISSTHNTYDLRFVTHENARELIQLACEESNIIRLYVGHTRAAQGVQKEKTVLTQEQYDPFGIKDEGPVQVNDNNYATICEDLFINNETDNENEEQLIVSFDFDDYQRYENRSKIRQKPLLKSRLINQSTGFLTVGQKQPNIIKSTTSSKITSMKSDSAINDSHQNGVVDKETTRPLRLKETTIREAYNEKLRREQGKAGQIGRANLDGGLRWRVD